MKVDRFEVSTAAVLEALMLTQSRSVAAICAKLATAGHLSWGEAADLLDHSALMVRTAETDTAGVGDVLESISDTMRGFADGIRSAGVQPLRVIDGGRDGEPE